ncbi:MAG: hypothetical protein NUW24_15145 [Anaerolineae bacterium]|jgi:hypothetical protein|nr:hypothetical protein [Anaerolineae bacterium]MDH7474123.1 hypothetical protein [Anaerolineae bacterium]
MTDLLNGPTRPIIVLLLGALVIGWLDRLTRPRDKGVLLVLLVADGLFALLSLRARLPLHVILGHWRDLSSLGFDWGLGVDILAFLFAVVLLFLALALSVIAIGHPLTPRAPLLTLLAAALGFIFATDLVTLSTSGFLLDMAFAWALVTADNGGEGGQSAAWVVGMGGLANLLFLTAALTLRLEGRYSDLNSALSSSRALFLVTLAILLRLGIYPLYFWLPVRVKNSLARSWLHLVPVVTGLWLPACVYGLTRGSWPWPPFLLTLGSLSFLAAAILAWGDTRTERVLSWVILTRLGYGLVLVTLGIPPMPIAVNLLLGAGLLFVAPIFVASWRRVSERWGRWRWAVEIPAAAGVGMLAGVPGALGFVERTALYRALLAQDSPSLLGISLLAESLLVAALLRVWFVASPDIQGDYTGSAFTRWCVLVSAVALTTVGLVLGLHPPLLSRLFAGTDVLPSFFTVLEGITLAQAAALALPLVGGIALHRYRDEVWAWVAGYWDTAYTVLRLEWLAKAVSTPWAAGREFVRAAGEISMGQGYLGWVFLIGLLVLLFALR